jgi:hypothetical protein
MYLSPDDNPVVIYDICVVLENLLQVGCGVDSVIHCCLYTKVTEYSKKARLFCSRWIGLHPPHNQSWQLSSKIDSMNRQYVMDNALIHAIIRHSNRVEPQIC